MRKKNEEKKSWRENLENKRKLRHSDSLCSGGPIWILIFLKTCLKTFVTLGDKFAPCGNNGDTKEFLLICSCLKKGGPIF